MKRCLISGITGSGGSFLAEHILENHPDWEVWGISRWGSTKSSRNIDKIKDKLFLRESDLNDLSSIIRVLKECKPDRVYHMAATANVHIAFTTPISILQNNLMGTANFLEAVRMECPETIFQVCSTSEVFGSPETMPILETHPLNPSNPYAVSKLASEKLAYSYYKAYGLPLIISRCFCYANPRRYDLFATSFALQIARIEQGKQKILKHGNLASIRTIMSVKDMAEAYWIASEKCKYAEAYNIGGIEPISVGGFLDKLIERANCKIITEQNPDLLRPSDITNQCPDVTKFFEATGWKPKYSIDDCATFLMEEARETVKNQKN